MAPRLFRQGEIYWIENCPPLGGDKPKKRGIVVVSPPEQLKKATEPIMAVAITGTQFNPAPSDVPMPTIQTDPQTTSGLTKPCWAIPEWCLQIIDRSILQERGGYISGAKLAKVLAGYVAFIANGGQPIIHPNVPPAKPRAEEKGS